MRRAVALGVLVALALPATAADAKRRAVPSRLMVEAREWNLTLSRPVLGRGPAIVQLVVQGQDGHDLKLRRIGGRGAARGVGETRPGQTAAWVGSLRSGRYRLYCSLPGHAAAGMRATLRVR